MKKYTIKEKHFDELTNAELYEIMRERVAVFVVEQKCPYQELDGKDIDSYHLFMQREDGSIAAYLRVLKKKDETGVAQIGRVLTTERGSGLGGALLHAGVLKAQNEYHADEIYLAAQVYAVGFYQKEGFRVVSEPFLEDGIPHVQMRLSLNGRSKG